MAVSLVGFDRYSLSAREVVIGQEHAHVTLTVDAASGSSTGEALLTPAQARSVAAGLLRQADLADEAAGLEGTFDGAPA